jgi:Tol biopolymer transport system component
VGGWDLSPDIQGFYIESLDHASKRRVAEISSMDWSPDGQSVVYSEYGNIFTALLDGSNRINLTQTVADDDYPKWSPDGHLIALIRDPSETAASLYLMNADGSSLHKLAELSFSNLYSSFNYTWLPNGKYILYDDNLIDIQTGGISKLHFRFDSSSAVWFMKPEAAADPIPRAP